MAQKILMSEKFSYEKSINEIEKIISEIESDTIGIDKLSDKVAKATELLKKCKTKLVATQQKIDNLLEEKI